MPSRTRKPATRDDPSRMSRGSVNVQLSRLCRRVEAHWIRWMTRTSSERRCPGTSPGRPTRTPPSTTSSRWPGSSALLTLPDEARVPGVYEKHRRAYPFCLPIEFASHNLLPEVRDGAIDLFHELDIPWHARWPAARATTCSPRRCSASTRCSRWSPTRAHQARLRRRGRHRRGAGDRGRPVPHVRVHRAHRLLRRGRPRRQDSAATGRQLHQRRRRVPLPDVGRRDRARAGRVEVHRVLPRRQGPERDHRRRPDRSVRGRPRRERQPDRLRRLRSSCCSTSPSTS